MNFKEFIRYLPDSLKNGTQMNADENFFTAQILNTNAANRRMTRIFSIFIHVICIKNGRQFAMMYGRKKIFLKNPRSSAFVSVQSG